MKRMLTVAVVSLLAATFLSYSPATAHGVDVCVGNGTATTDEAVYYPLPGNPSAGGGATFSFAIGGCINTLVEAWPWPHSGTVQANFIDGVLTSPLPDPPFGNYCGHSEGTVDIPGHPGQWISVASMLIVFPQAGSLPDGSAGVVNAVPDPQLNSCLTGANRFIVSGALVLFSDDIP